MGAVSRARSDLRRARRQVRKLEEEHQEALEELADGLSDLDVEGVATVLRGFDVIERTIARERERLMALENELDIAIAARKEKRREAWEEVRQALNKFGPSVLDVVGDVVLIATSPRAERVELATRTLLEHVDIPIPKSDVARLAERIVDALDD